MTRFRKLLNTVWHKILLSYKTVRWFFISKLYKKRLDVERFMILANIQERSKTLFRFEVKRYPYKKYKLGKSFYEDSYFD